MSDDWKLIEESRRGDGQAWQTLVERYQRLIFFIANQYQLTADDGDELVQLTFTTLLENLHVFHAESNLKAWLATVARRHAYRFLHRYDRESVYADHDLRDSDLLSGQATELDRRWEIAEWLHDGLERLGERCRRLLYALYLENVTPSYAEIADRLNLSLGSVGPTRARCLSKLRNLLQT